MTILAAIGAVLALTTSFVPAAQAAFGVSSWEAGTCKADVPTKCTYSSDKSQFFTQAAGHPPVGLTDFAMNLTSGPPPLGGTPEGAIKDARVDLPEGLNVDPQAVPQCNKATFESNAAVGCAASQVGISEVTSEVAGLPVGPLPFPVYNLDPPQGVPALFGFTVGLPGIPIANVYLVADVAWDSDYHEGFTISEIPNSLPLVDNRLVFDGTKGGTFLTMGSQCNGPSTTGLKVDSYENPGSFLSYATTPPANIDGCQSVPFAPSVVTTTESNATDSPTAVAAEVKVPQGGQPLNNSTLRMATVSLPKGLGLNPSSAPSLHFCSNDQLGKGTRKAVACPADSQIGTVSIQTPVLPANSLPGKVFLGQQLSRDPASGQEYRVFVDAESPRYGLSIRLIGNVAADPQTGQLTATFPNNPQVAFSAFRLQFNGGDKAPLTSPPTCGPNTTTSSISPWSGTAAVAPTNSFTLAKAPGGGDCAKTLASRPFSPGFSAAPNSNAAAAFTPFAARITRNDGQQELKGVDVTLPPGATAKLDGVPYCPGAAIAAAAARAGSAERAKSSCPDKSQVGVATVSAGSGSSPLQITGKAFLAGPYKGAPLSLVVITPGVAGPFDLGTVVVRVALFVDPETAQIHVVSDAIPDVFGGAKLDIRSVAVNVNKSDFTLNGTNCSKQATAGSLKGGGADPANPASFSSFPVSDQVQLDKCDGLAFKPKLNLRLFGAHKRAKHPKLRAILKARPGDANISRASVGLPHALFLDQASLSTICTRVQFSAGDCPKKSIYGYARAFTPLLGKPLEGPVYLRSSNNPLPDLVAHLAGQVTIDLVGRIDSFKGGIRTTFDRVPDVPVSKFTMTLPGGKHGLLVTSQDICKKPRVRAVIQFKGQNGKKANKRTKLRVPCGKKASGKHGKQGKKHGK
ncbi:MAG TPA: hypothetical protein VGO36_00350 [Solirubrobacterales bacterium]|nr:hypothetical protein [Solirubrobacterales bacterium]